MNILGVILLFVALGFFIFVYRVEKERDRLKYILPSIAAFGIMGFALIFRENITEFPIPGFGTIKTVAQKTLKDAEFVEETRKAVVAQSETIGSVARQANEMKPEISRISGEVKKFEAFLTDMQNILQKEYNTVLEEVESLKLQSHLLILGNNVLYQDDREAFEEIIRIAQSSRDGSAPRKSAIGEVRKYIYQLKDRLSGDLFYRSKETHPAVLSIRCGRDSWYRPAYKWPTNELFSSLDKERSNKGRSFEEIIRMIMALGGRSEKEVPDRLLQMARSEKNLIIFLSALISFECVADRLEPINGITIDSLGESVEYLNARWDDNMMQLIEMFDIDKVEQWWMQYSKEVIKRLK